MKIMVNGVFIDATTEQEAEILAFQHTANRDPELFKSKLQEAIDNKAMGKGYTNGFACATYVTSTNPQWAAEAQAFVAWRDICFDYGYDYLSKVQSGEIANPNLEDFLMEIPAMVWPELPPEE